ncbi:MAG: putative toxin-antitoxin system toxin component, PIN family [Thermomicrobiales bacterium]
MTKAVLDTNVLASGVLGFAAAEQAPSRLLHLWQEQRFELIVSEPILAELINTMEKPYFRQRLTVDQIRSTQRLLQDRATLVSLTASVSGVATHSEDDLVLAAAVSARADYLVTGDKQLQLLGAYRGVRILSPRAFLDLLETTGAE